MLFVQILFVCSNCTILFAQTIVCAMLSAASIGVDFYSFFKKISREGQNFEMGQEGKKLFIFTWLKVNS